MKTWQSILLGIFLGIISTGIIFIISRQPSGEPIHLFPSPSPAPILVYITGAVKNPGVYSLPVSSRVQGLVDQAGGLIEGSDSTALNLAAVLSDGQKIVVPFTKTDIPETSAGAVSTAVPTQVSYPININTATQEELDLLPGIGASKAGDIVNYRDQKGPFNTIEDIQNVPGIGPGIFLKIKELISVK